MQLLLACLSGEGGARDMTAGPESGKFHQMLNARIHTLREWASSEAHVHTHQKLSVAVCGKQR